MQILKRHASLCVFRTSDKGSDALRGLGLAGIALANYPEFALWTFLSTAGQEALPTAAVDKVVRFLRNCWPHRDAWP